MTISRLYEERKTAIHLLRSGRSPTEVAQELNRSVGWVYKWQVRHKQESWAGLQGQSQAPKRHGRRISSEVRQAIRQARSELEAEAADPKNLKYIGAPAVQARLDQDQNKVAPLPSLRTIERVLTAAEMTNRHSSASKPKIEYPRLRPAHPHHLIQVDIVPHYLLGGEAVACFNALDVVSRYPTGQALAQRRATDAVAFLCHVWQEIGLPHYTQVDNEGCFSGGFTHQAVLGQVVRLALWVGTELVFSPVRHPESNGTVERFHQDYDNHVWEVRLQDRLHVNERGADFFQNYRHSRHHSRLNGQTPAEVHQRRPPKRLPTNFELPAGKLPLTCGQVHFMRRVNPKGAVSVLNLEWNVPDPHPNKGVWVTLDFTLNGATLHIYDAAPDIANRSCLAAYPFPLSEKVQPHSTASQLQSAQEESTQQAISLQLPLKLITLPIRSTAKLVASLF
jgi:transposase InsO family protein